MPLTADELRGRLKAITRPAPVAVDTASLGKVFVRQLTGKEFDYLVNRDDGLERTEFVTRSLCGDDGEPLLDGDDVANLELVGAIPNADMRLLFRRVQEINGLVDTEKLADGKPNPTSAG